MTPSSKSATHSFRHHGRNRGGRCGQFPGSTQKATLTQRVWEIRVDSVLKLDRAAKREASDENQQEVPQ